MVESSKPDTKYNGWTNYETWNLALWIGNEEGSCRYWRGVAQECWDDAREERTRNGSILFSREERAALDLADRLKDEITEANPLKDQCSFYGDVMGAALSEVNWYEIAAGWIEEIDQ